jgi:hypothetical protein
MSETASQDAPAAQSRAEVLVALFTHFDAMMWQAPTQYLSAAAFVLGAGVWSAARLDDFIAPTPGRAETLFGVSLAFAGLVIGVGANHMANSRSHRNKAREELARISGLDYFRWNKEHRRVSASRLAIALLFAAALLMVCGGAGVAVFGAITALPARAG